jgi:hypothetical protein
MKVFEVWHKNIRETLEADSPREACVHFERKYGLDSCVSECRILDESAVHPASSYGRSPSAEYIEVALKGYIYEAPINIYTDLPD